MKKINFAIVFILTNFFIITGCSNYSNDTGNIGREDNENTTEIKTLEEIALKHYDKDFDTLFIYSDNSEENHDFDEKTINELLEYFKGLSYKKISENELQEINNEVFEIRFKDKNCNTLEIEIEDKNRIVIGLYYIKEVKDEEKNATKIERNDERLTFEIDDDKLDLEYIESVFKLSKKSN